MKLKEKDLKEEFVKRKKKVIRNSNKHKRNFI